MSSLDIIILSIISIYVGFVFYSIYNMKKGDNCRTLKIILGISVGYLLLLGVVIGVAPIIMFH